MLVCARLACLLNGLSILAENHEDDIYFYDHYYAKTVLSKIAHVTWLPEPSKLLARPTHKPSMSLSRETVGVGKE